MTFLRKINGLIFTLFFASFLVNDASLQAMGGKNRHRRPDPTKKEQKHKVLSLFLLTQNRIAHYAETDRTFYEKLTQKVERGEVNTKLLPGHSIFFDLCPPSRKTRYGGTNYALAPRCGGESA